MVASFGLHSGPWEKSGFQPRFPERTRWLASHLSSPALPCPRLWAALYPSGEGAGSPSHCLPGAPLAWVSPSAEGEAWALPLAGLLQLSPLSPKPCISVAGGGCYAGLTRVREACSQVATDPLPSGCAHNRVRGGWQGVPRGAAKGMSECPPQGAERAHECILKGPMRPAPAARSRPKSPRSRCLVPAVKGFHLCNKPHFIPFLNCVISA